MKIKILIQKDGKEYLADGDKVFDWLFERYLKNEGRKANTRVVPYKTKLENFFTTASADVEWITDLSKAFPGIDIISELPKAKAWLVSTNTHRKDLKKFCYNWMSKANPQQIEHNRSSFKLDSTGNAYIGYCSCGKSDFYDKYEIKGADSRCCKLPIQPTRSNNE